MNFCAVLHRVFQGEIGMQAARKIFVPGVVPTQCVRRSCSPWRHGRFNDFITIHEAIKEIGGKVEIGAAAGKLFVPE